MQVNQIAENYIQIKSKTSTRSMIQGLHVLLKQIHKTGRIFAPHFVFHILKFLLLKEMKQKKKGGMGKKIQSIIDLQNLSFIGNGGTTLGH